VSHKALNDEHIDAAVEEVGDAGSTEVMRADRRNVGDLGEVLNGVSHELIRQPAHDDATAFAHFPKQRTGGGPAQGEPPGHCLKAATVEIDRPSDATFAAADDQPSRARVKVGVVERHRFAPPRITLVEDRQERRIAYSFGRCHKRRTAPPARRTTARVLLRVR
jgi:hypothetical protein